MKIKTLHIAILSLIIWTLFNIQDIIYVMGDVWINPTYVYGKVAKWVIPILLYLGFGFILKKNLNLTRGLILGLPVMFGHLIEEIITLRIFDLPFGFPRIILIPGLAYVFGLIIVGLSVGVLWIIDKLKKI